MTDDLDHARRQHAAMIRERRRGLHRLLAGLLILGAVSTLISAGALTWLAGP